jgi:hypothetical protein
VTLAVPVFTDQAGLSAPIGMGGTDRFRSCCPSRKRRLFRRGNRREQNPARRTHRGAVDWHLCSGRKRDPVGNRPDWLQRVSKMTTTKNHHGTVLITGSSSGIGRELTRAFGACAETLVVVARRLDRLKELRAELLSHHPRLKVIVLAANLYDERDVERLLGQVSGQAGPVDMLVNNASQRYFQTPFLCTTTGCGKSTPCIPSSWRSRNSARRRFIFGGPGDSPFLRRESVDLPAVFRCLACHRSVAAPAVHRAARYRILPECNRQIRQMAHFPRAPKEVATRSSICAGSWVNT